MFFPKVGVQILLFLDRGVQMDLEPHLLHVYNFTMNYKMCSLNRFEVTLVAFVLLFAIVQMSLQSTSI